MITAEQIIEFFKMKPLPKEGGFYVETYRSQDEFSRPGHAGPKNLATAILYLLTPDTFSRLHRLKSDEVFHFYLGDPVTMLLLGPDGSSEIITLGQDILNGQRIQLTVPKNAWQGAFLKKGGRFALMGTTVAPGFEFDDFEPSNREELLSQYPRHKKLVLKLTQQQ